ncbi:MAG: Rpn family recombination-promoting nuclease/putative transposase, partial [Candidatus Omnitrophota bacterium]
LDIMKLSDKERKAYEAYLEDMRYEASMFESSYKVGELKGIEKGVEIGMEKGSKDKAIEMARESLKEGLAVELVSKLTGLSIEDINKIESLS